MLYYLIKDPNEWHNLAENSESAELDNKLGGGLSTILGSRE
jgi:hypothetical protein